MKNKFFIAYFVEDCCGVGIKSGIIKTDMNAEALINDYLNNKKSVINIIKLN